METQEEMEMMVKMLNIGMSVLRHRIILIVAMLLTFSLFVWCVYNPDPFRIISATIFGFFSYVVSKGERMPQGDDQ